MRGIGLQIRDQRKRRGLSQKEVAERCGISPVTVGRVESGMDCGIDTVERICGALGLLLLLVEKERIYGD